MVGDQKAFTHCLKPVGDWLQTWQQSSTTGSMNTDNLSVTKLVARRLPFCNLVQPAAACDDYILLNNCFIYCVIYIKGIHCFISCFVHISRFMSLADFYHLLMCPGRHFNPALSAWLFQTHQLDFNCYSQQYQLKCICKSEESCFKYSLGQFTGAILLFFVSGNCKRNRMGKTSLLLVKKY